METKEDLLREARQITSALRSMADQIEAVLAMRRKAYDKLGTQRWELGRHIEQQEQSLRTLQADYEGAQFLVSALEAAYEQEKPDEEPDAPDEPDDEPDAPDEPDEEPDEPDEEPDEPDEEPDEPDEPDDELDEDVGVTNLDEDDADEPDEEPEASYEDMGTLEAAIAAMQELQRRGIVTDGGLHYQQISEEMKRGGWKTSARQPSKAVYASLYVVGSNNPRHPVESLGSGRFALSDW